MLPRNIILSTAPEQDKNLGIKTYLNGALVSDIMLDTSKVATDTIDYVASDQAGNNATSTRTVIIDAAASASPPPAPPPAASTASSTATTTTL